MRTIQILCLYAWSNHFTVCTNHTSWRWLMKISGHNGRLVRWRMALSRFDIVKYKNSLLNTKADALSRLCCLEETTVRLSRRFTHVRSSHRWPLCSGRHRRSTCGSHLYVSVACLFYIKRNSFDTESWWVLSHLCPDMARGESAILVWSSDSVVPSVPRTSLDRFCYLNILLLLFCSFVIMPVTD